MHITKAGRILIAGGRVLDPATKRDELANVLVEGSRIVDVGPRRPGADKVVDAGGAFVVPGLIDMHVHLREPGGEAAETIETGCSAAVAGGFAAVACMPNTEPPLDSAESLHFVKRRAFEAGQCRVYPVACMSLGRQGKELVDFSKLSAAGAVAFSDDGNGLGNSELMSGVFERLAALGKVAIQHCEDPRFIRGAMHDGTVAKELGIPGISPLAEELMITRDLKLCEIYQARYHVAHISTTYGVELVRQAKAKGVRVSAEVCPHHLLLTDEACRNLDPNTKVHPPLRPREDVEACIAGVLDGTIDMLVTDHAPHTEQAKSEDFLSAPPGMIGLETALALAVKALVEPGHISWLRLVELMSAAPARLFDLPGGKIAPGEPADITVIDPERRWTVDVNRFRSKARNCPFDGEALVGKAVCTIVGGAVKFEEGREP